MENHISYFLWGKHQRMNWVVNLIVSNFPCSHYQVAVVILPRDTGISSLGDPDTQFSNINQVAYDETFCSREFTSPFVYVTAEFARDLLPSSGQYVIGQESQPNDRRNLYTNGFLCFSKSYTFFLRAYTFPNSASSVCNSARLFHHKYQ